MALADASVNLVRQSSQREPEMRIDGIIKTMHGKTVPLKGHSGAFPTQKARLETTQAPFWAQKKGAPLGTPFFIPTHFYFLK